MRIGSYINRLSLPRKLSGEERRILKIAINSWTLYYLLDRIYKEFIIKSAGGTDSLGVKWKPLSENRRIYKPLRGQERSLYRKSRGTKKEQLQQRNPPINIDTKRLLKSLKPGKVVNGVYYSTSKDQWAKVTEATIRFKSLVPYADEVQAIRPFIPPGVDIWLDQAVNLAVSKVQTQLRMFI